MVLAFGEIMVGTVAGTENYYGTELSVCEPAYQIEKGLAFALRGFCTVQKAVEEFGGGFGGGCTQDENAGEIFPVVVERGILHTGEIFQHRGFLFRGFLFRGQKPLHITLQRHNPGWASLKMMMVRCRSPRMWSIVEKSVGLILARQIQNVNIPLPY